MALCRGGRGDYFTQRDTSDRKDHAVAQAMQNAARDHNCEGKVYITHPTECGGVVIGADPPYSSTLLTYNGET